MKSNNPENFIRIRKTLFFLIIFFISSTTSFPQGFDWQYSSRMPTKYPYFFVGGMAEANYLLHYGYIDLTETYSKCCTFEHGKGIGTAFGISSEYWSGLWAWYGNLSYAKFPGKFLADGFTLKRKLDDGTVYDVKYQNEFNSSMSYIFLELGGKYRLLKSHFHIGGGLKFGFLADNSSEQIERIVSPAEERFADGTQSQVLSRGKISDIKSYVITPRIRLGYDLTFGLGMYATPSVSIGLPILNISQNAQWQTWSFTFGFSVYKDLLKE